MVGRIEGRFAPSILGRISCPTCHRPYIVENAMKLDLNTNTVYNARGSVKLGPSQAEVLYTIINHHPRRVNWTTIWDDCWPNIDSDTTKQRIYEFVYRIRKHIAPLGWTVRTDRGTGYYLEELK